MDLFNRRLRDDLRVVLPILHHGCYQLPELLLFRLRRRHLHQLLQGRLHQTVSLVAVEDKLFVGGGLGTSLCPVTVRHAAFVHKPVLKYLI